MIFKAILNCLANFEPFRASFNPFFWLLPKSILAIFYFFKKALAPIFPSVAAVLLPSPPLKTWASPPSTSRRPSETRRRQEVSKGLIKGWFILAAAICVFRSGLHQCRDRNFSISLRKCNHLPQMQMENAVMWMDLYMMCVWSMCMLRQTVAVQKIKIFSSMWKCNCLQQLHASNPCLVN